MASIVTATLHAARTLFVAFMFSPAVALHAADAPANSVVTPSAVPVASASPLVLSGEIGKVLTVPLLQSAMAMCKESELPGIFLRLNGFNTGLRPVACGPNPQKPEVTFYLSPHNATRSDSTTLAWARILSDPWDTSAGDFVRAFQLAVIKDDGTVLQIGKLNLTLVPQGKLTLGFVLVALAWVAVLVAGWKSSMLRDSTSTAAGSQRPFSLARVQMAWWFALVIGAYVFIWMLKGDLVLLNGSILALIGISGVTTVTAAGIDSSRVMPETTGNFFHDILTDVNGITLARLQLLLWNLVLGVFFVMNVITELQMPAFDNATLGLLGISAGTYIGFKVPEKHIDAGAASTAMNPDPKSGYTPQ